MNRKWIKMIVFPLVLMSLIAIAVVPSLTSASTSVLGSTPDWTYDGATSGQNTGIKTSGGCDFNGDGIEDILFSDYRYDNGQTDEGRAIVIFGSATSISSTPDWSFETDETSALVFSVACLGDVNDDDVDDIAVGSHSYNGTGSDLGKVWVFYGSSSGTPDTTADWSKTGENNGDQFGHWLESAGDVNGDGINDLAVSATFYGNSWGKAYVYYGGSSGLSTTADWTYAYNSNNSYFGKAIAAGDINGDGYEDLAALASGAAGTGSNKGRVFIFNGSSSGLSSTPDWTYDSTDSSLGFNMFAGIGDANNDGYDDVALGDYLKSDGTSQTGATYVFYGSSTGLASTPDWTSYGRTGGDRYGFIAGPAGDVNDDGYSDIVIAALEGSDGETSEGLMYVYLGSSTGFGSTEDWYYGSGQAGADIYHAWGAGDVNGDGADDVAGSFYNYDDGSTQNVGRVALFYGTPSDTEDVAITGLSITYTLSVSNTYTFTPTVATGDNVSYSYKMTPYNQGKVESTGATFNFTPDDRWLLVVEASNGAGTVTTSLIIPEE